MQNRACIICAADRHGNVFGCNMYCSVYIHIPSIVNVLVAVFAKPKIYSNKHILDPFKGKARC